ncbi:MAG: hypothetical protein JNK76_26855 [Planctomycetales bacterium]|nr:hypothetical protein [Planctomycetales bacterium]
MTTSGCWSVTVVLGAVLSTISCRHAPESFALGIQRAEKVVLYEGLPHQSSEHELLAEELRTKATQEFHNYPFYAEPLALRDEDAKRLSEIRGNVRTFHQYRGPKGCGGFHPDYLVEWHVGADRFQALICFGCTEVKLFGPGLESLNDLEEDAENQLRELLKRYRKHRPASWNAEYQVPRRTSRST